MALRVLEFELYGKGLGKTGLAKLFFLN